ncbi:MAG: bifunctional hydroxymethylpyrimidine kinase/phosphomethylpyrimidine kinase [Euryarchaeota archaeon]|nr:bifunctional hydroxymethylpyrimidine kinase/phosphomethylpyrimidine kinase [Euryarchaeota archaeon]
MKTALTIAGSDSGGGAGIQADLKTFAALGVHGTSVITSLTAQNTQAVEAVQDVPPDFIEAQFDALHRDFDIKAAKTGMLSSSAIIETVMEKLGDYPLVVDPVMVAESGGRLLEEDAVESLKGLFPKAAVITPNLAEAEVLTGMEIRSIDDMKDAAEKMAGHGCSVLVKGGHLNATDVLYHGGEFHVFEGELLGGGAHGSGCTMASAVCACLAKGYDLVDAVSEAKDFVTRAIANAHSPGRGAPVVNQLRDILDASERYRVREALAGVVARMEGRGFAPFIPEVGTNMAYALPRARDSGDVCAISGRVVRVSGRARAVGSLEFGASKHVAAIVLAAMAHDPGVRCAVNIRYSPETVDACKRAGLSVASFSREEEPEGVSTMEWGTDSAIRSMGRVPDVIYDRGGVGKEAMVRVLGRDPEDVWQKLQRVIAASKGAGS